MFLKCLVLGLLATVQTINSAAAPFITKCHLDDAKCIKASAQKAIPDFVAGIPSLGVKTMDPLFMKKIDASSDTLKLVLNDITGTGLKQCIAKKMQIDSAQMKLYVKLQCDVNFEGLYDINGRLLILPIQGKGKLHVVLRKILISAEVDLKEITGKDGLQHWNIKKYKHSYELKDKATIELENLFNGNEALGRAAKELLANSPNEIVTEVCPPIVAKIVQEIVENIKTFFNKVPLDEVIEK